MYVCMYVGMYACMYVRMYVLYVCTHVRVYIHACIDEDMWVLIRICLTICILVYNIERSLSSFRRLRSSFVALRVDTIGFRMLQAGRRAVADDA